MADRIPNLLVAFGALPVPLIPPNGEEKPHLSAFPFPGFGLHRIAKDASGAPSVLIKTADGTAVPRPTPILLEHLAVQHNVDCHIFRSDGTTEEGRFTMVRCVGADRDLHAHFLRVMAPVVAGLGAAPSRREVGRAISQLAELFQSSSQPSRKSVQGLWAELLLIANSRRPDVLVDAWHGDPEEVFDFSSRDQRVEVKSAAGEIRRHHFSLRQARPPEGANSVRHSLPRRRLDSLTGKYTKVVPCAQ